MIIKLFLYEFQFLDNFQVNALEAKEKGLGTGGSRLSGDPGLGDRNIWISGLI